MTIRLIILISALLVMSGCSVFMAADKKGVSTEEVMDCQTQTCFASLRDTVLVDGYSADGVRVNTYKSLLPQGSTGRAVMHGLLDVATLGIWEVAGTPIEGSKGKDKFLVYTTHFDNDGRLLKVEMGGLHGTAAESEQDADTQQNTNTIKSDEDIVIDNNSESLSNSKIEDQDNEMLWEESYQP